MTPGASMFAGLWGKVRSLGYDGGASDRVRRDLGWDRVAAKDEEGMVGQDGSRETLRQKAIDLQRNDPVVAGIGNRIALFTVGGDGILPQWHTSDPAWNRAAEEWLTLRYAPTCDSRGRISLWEMQWQAASLLPIMGGLYFQKLADGTLRPIEPERIRQPQDNNIAKAYVDGVKVDSSTGRIISYRVHARDSKGGFSEKHAEQDVPAAEIIPAINPPWRPDQVREVPALAAVIPALWDVKEMNQFTLNTAKVQSMVLGALAKNGGNGLSALPRVNETSPSVGKRQTYQFDWGQILELFPGESLDLKNSPTPGSQHVPYVKFQYALCAAALGFPYEFLTLDLSGLDFSRQKGMLLLVNNAIRPYRAHLIRRFLNPLVWWRVPLAMERGELPPAPVDSTGRSEWDKVSWQGPEEPWIDRKESLEADMLEIQAGLLTFSEAAKRRGKDYETQLRGKAADEATRQQVSEDTGVDPDRLSVLSVPGQAAPVAPADPDTDDDPDDDADAMPPEGKPNE